MIAELSENQLVDGMRLVSRLGEGGMGTVWKAEYLGAPVAVKFLKGAGAKHHFAMEAVGQYRLSKDPAPEARYFGKIEHYQPDGTPYLRMEYLDGTDLARALSRGGMPVPRALELMEHLLSAMAFAHERGFVHGDLKPQNVILPASGETPIKIIDCGFGYAIDRETPPEELELSYGKSLRSASLGVSTSVYAAPERFTRRFLDDPVVAKSCDVYSLGRIFYQMLSGEEPANVFPLEGRVAGATRALDVFLAGCVQNRAEGRWGSAGEALAAFRAVRGGAVVVEPVRVTEPEPLRAIPVDSTCPSCKGALPYEGWFCSACGWERPGPVPSVVRCGFCGWNGASSAKYCSRCGTLLLIAGGLKGALRFCLVMGLLACVWSNVSAIIDLAENPRYNPGYYDGWTSSSYYYYSDPDYVAAAFGGLIFWVLFTIGGWVQLRFALRRPATPLLWSCVPMFVFACLSIACLANSRGSGDHEGFSAANMIVGGLFSTVGFIWILVERSRWYRRWRPVSVP